MLTRTRPAQGKHKSEGIISKDKNDLTAQAEQLPSNQRHFVWNRCSEGLPKRSGRYLIAYRREPGAKLTIFICDFKVEESKWIGMHLFPIEVVYWMRVKLPAF